MGEVAVWVIGEDGLRVRLIDDYQPTVYISGKQEDIERLASTFYASQAVAKWNFAYKYANATDTEKSRVLEMTLKDCRKTSAFTRYILELGNYLRYEVYNCDLHGDRTYLFSCDLFPLAFVEVEISQKGRLKYQLLDSVESLSYTVPPFRVMKLNVDIAKAGKIASFQDPLGAVTVSQGETKITIDWGKEDEKLSELVNTVRKLDPDIILTSGGDAFLFPYLIERASANDVLDEFILSRDPVPFVKKSAKGKTFFSYGRTFYRAPTARLFGRVHIDVQNSFALNEADFEGLIEIARTFRMPLHTAARSSIGSSMSSLQFYQALKSDVLLPRNKSITEAFKSAYELLVADRGGIVYEPQVGLHDKIAEVDFTSMYPTLMANNNISAETVLCKCCPDSHIRIPELNYHICEKREGIVPKALKIVLKKRLEYKRLRDEAHDPQTKEAYDKRQIALKWILVTCFGYLGYRNAKFGTIDGHIGVCAFGRDAFLTATRLAEARGFTVVHGIVDSLWLKKPDAALPEYQDLCAEASAKIGVPLNFEGQYKWIAFLPSRMHPKVGVLNRYYGVMDTGKLKLRGLEVRRSDTPKFVHDTQMDMIKMFASADSANEFYRKIPEALRIVRDARERLLNGEVPVWDLIITKHMSKKPEQYRQKVSQVIAAEQLVQAGGEAHAGGNISFLFTDAKNRRHSRRVRAEQLIERNVNPDIQKYLLLLYAATANLLSFAGYTTKTVYELIQGYGCKPLTDYTAS